MPLQIFEAALHDTAVWMLLRSFNSVQWTIVGTAGSIQRRDCAMRSTSKIFIHALIIGVILFLISSTLWKLLVEYITSDTFFFGFPMPIYTRCGLCSPEQQGDRWHFLGLLLDMMLWYGLSYGLVVRRAAPMTG
jgi:hypothetical protein